MNDLEKSITIRIMQEDAETIFFLMKASYNIRRKIQYKRCDIRAFIENVS